MSRTYHAPAVADAVGITYRQLDYWIRAGYLPVPTQGIGYRRELTQEQAEQTARLAELVRAGVLPQEAAKIAVTGASSHLDPLGRIVTITLDIDAINARLNQNLTEGQVPA